MFSLNNKLILEQYKKKELTAKVEGGFAKMEHKVSLKPLKVLVQAKLNDGSIIPAGSLAYVKEEYLHNNSGMSRNGGTTIPSFSNEDISSEPFIILDLNQVEILDTNQPTTVISGELRIKNETF